MTPTERASRSVSRRNGTAMAVKMITPPMVGVPALAWCSCGPSSRICWPNSRARRNSMNLGERKMQMSSEAVPPMRTSPISRPPRSARPAVARLRRERLGHDLEPDAARPLDEHEVAGRDQLARERGRGARRRPRRGPRRRTAPTIAAARGPTAISSVDARRPPRGRRSPRGARRSRGPSSSMSPSTATRRPAVSCVARSSRAARIESGLAL